MSARPIGHPLVRAGTVIDGRYKVIGLLGEGGAGLVLEAEQLSVGRRVALKILRLDRWSEDATKRFAREAHALGRV